MRFMTNTCRGRLARALRRQSSASCWWKELEYNPRIVGRLWKEAMLRRLILSMVLVLALIAGLGVSGCSSSDGSGADVVSGTEEVDAPDASGTDETAEPELGTKDNPLPLGTSARIGDWEVTVTDVVLNANDLIASTNEFNEPPVEGSQYVLVNVKGKYVGEESGTFWVDMAYKFLGAGGNTYDGTESMAVTPNPIMDAGETFPGAEITGDLLYEVPSDQVEGGALIVEELMSFDDSRVFFAIK